MKYKQPTDVVMLLAINIAWRFHLTLIRMAVIKKTSSRRLACNAGVIVLA